MMTTEIFAERLKGLRNDHGISLKELAGSLDTTAQSLSLYERAERTINIDLLVKISKYFNVSTDYLLGLTGNKTNDTELQAVCGYTGLCEDAVKSLATCNNSDFFYFLLFDFFDLPDVISNEEKETRHKTILDKINITNDFIASDYFWKIVAFILKLDILSEKWEKVTINEIRAEINKDNEKRYWSEQQSKLSKDCDITRYLIAQTINEYINFYDKRVDDEHKRTSRNFRFEKEQKLKEKILKEMSDNGKHNPSEE